MRVRGKHLGFVTIFLIWLFIVAIPVALWYELKGPGYYAELNAIKRGLAGIPGVRVIEADGNYDLTLEDIYAVVEVAGKGRLKFYDLTLDSFKTPKHLFLTTIGPYRVKTQTEVTAGSVQTEPNTAPQVIRGMGYRWSIDVGAEGDCATLFPFRLKNVRDVIEHYDAICTELTKWPVAPATKHIRTPEGREFDYCVEKK